MIREDRTPRKDLNNHVLLPKKKPIHETVYTLVFYWRCQSISAIINERPIIIKMSGL